MKKFRNVTTAVKVKDFKKLAIHSESGKTKGCGMYCNKDEEYMVCPSCKTFVWHKSCLIPLYGQFGLKVPNIESSNWSCPNCTKEWVFNSDIKCWIKKFWKSNFHINLLSDLKILYILIYYIFSQHCWLFCWPNVDLCIFKRPNLKWYLICIFKRYRMQFGVSSNLLYVLKVTIIFKKWKMWKCHFFERIFFFRSL